jgi:uncharacterized protein YciI
MSEGEQEMARFAYVYFMTDDPVRVRSAAPKHTEHWHSLDLSGYTGGPFTDRSGGLITFLVDEPAQAEEAVANDPFVREGLIERSWLKQWEPVGA